MFCVSGAKLVSRLPRHTPATSRMPLPYRPVDQTYRRLLCPWYFSPFISVTVPKDLLIAQAHSQKKPKDFGVQFLRDHHWLETILQEEWGQVQKENTANRSQAWEPRGGETCRTASRTPTYQLAFDQLFYCTDKVCSSRYFGGSLPGC